MKKYTLPFYTKLSLVMIGLIASGYVAVWGKEILAPLVLAFLFSVLLFPLSRFFERRLRFPRSLSSLLSVVLLVVFILLVLFSVGTQISALTRDWPQFQSQVGEALGQLREWLQRRFHLSMEKQLSYLHMATDNMLSSGGTVIGQTVLSASTVFLFFIFTLIYTFFLLFYRSLLVRFLVALFREEHTPVVYEVIEQVQYIIKKYVVGLFFEMCLVAALTTGLLWILGVKYAPLLGLITGIFNLVPYIGIFTALLLSVLITFATVSAGKALVVAIAILLVHTLDSNVLMPRIVGSQVKINALVTVIGVVVGEMLWGIAGMFLSIPVIAIFKIVFDRVEDTKAWGLLLGEDHHHHAKKPVLAFPRRRRPRT
ncbi:AI-2E family transporter [Compostibacter hankyongensis]|uniref:AI-2E family transporter n=1 Tax=Compostibacter hankyongensis TaxID=1007089 RepID=A0ABP8GAW5_9BACT